MLKGRRSQTFTLGEKSQTSSSSSRSVNCSAPARNLTKSQLGGVIFGCKNNTIAECYSKLLFGLPAHHFSYVKNIVPGLPLFLFNYSDRRLHGIFEAAGPGQMNIDLYAWTNDGSEYTPYGAQVRVQIKLRCEALMEDKFQPIIAKNYYQPKLFWFELDKVQTHKLIELFSASPARTKSFRKQTPRLETLALNLAIAAEGGDNTKQDSEIQSDLEVCRSHDDLDLVWGMHTLETLLYDGDDDADGGVKDMVAASQNIGCELSYALVVRGGDSAPAPVLLKSWSALLKQETSFCTRTEIEDFKMPSNVEWEPSPPLDSMAKTEDSEVQELSSCSLHRSNLEAETSQSYVSASQEESQPSDNASPEDFMRFHDAVGDEGYLRKALVSEINNADLQPLLGKVLSAVEELNLFIQRQDQKISSLEQELVRQGLEIQQLKHKSKLSESSSLSGVEQANLEEPKWTDDYSADSGKKILILGGFDGSSWLSDLDFYSPFEDQMKSLTSMSSARPYSSAAVLNGEVYILGGLCGDTWNDVVESYNPVANKWTAHPSLNQKKGSLACVSLKDMIFAVGGGNGIDCFSEVEMLDLLADRWFPARSMHCKRFAPAAAELNGILYVVGGFEEHNYLSSAERFDPRDHAWRKLPSMNTKKACHCLAVLNEKLYALGGYDGDSMVPTMEIFDPRVGSWMMGESMKTSRGYFGAAVINDQIYAIGGVQEDDKILDTVECYKEGHGWQVTDLKAIGRRGFLSAVVV